MCDTLISEHAILNIYDPKVSSSQMIFDINYLNTRSEFENKKYLNIK